MSSYSYNENNKFIEACKNSLFGGAAGAALGGNIGKIFGVPGATTGGAIGTILGLGYGLFRD